MNKRSMARRGKLTNSISQTRGQDKKTLQFQRKEKAHQYPSSLSEREKY